eukprot:403375318
MGRRLISALMTYSKNVEWNMLTCTKMIAYNKELPAMKLKLQQAPLKNGGKSIKVECSQKSIVLSNKKPKKGFQVFPKRVFESLLKEEISSYLKDSGITQQFKTFSEKFWKKQSVELKQCKRNMPIGSKKHEKQSKHKNEEPIKTQMEERYENNIRPSWKEDKAFQDSEVDFDNQQQINLFDSVPKHSQDQDQSLKSSLRDSHIKDFSKQIFLRIRSNKYRLATY